MTVGNHMFSYHNCLQPLKDHKYHAPPATHVTVQVQLSLQALPTIFVPNTKAHTSLVYICDCYSFVCKCTKLDPCISTHIYSNSSTCLL